MPRKSRAIKTTSISYRRREEILLAEVFSRPEWTSTAENGKRLQINTRRAVTAIGEIVAIIKRLPYSHQVELQSDLDQLQASSDLLAHVARVFELGKENSERAVKRAEAERKAKRKADIEALAKQMFGDAPAPESVQELARDLLLFDSKGVAEEFAKSKGYESGFVSLNQVYEIRYAINGPVSKLINLLATERLDLHMRGHGFTDDTGKRNVSLGWLDFEDWRAKKNGGTSPPQVTASKGTS